jgi:glycosyltransferase involved in cell wall biosynthesis
LHSVDIFLALQRSGITARSTALIAALAHGLPIVATRGPDADLWLLESGTMVIIDPTDIEKAVREVAQIAGDHQARRNLGRCAREFYQQHLSWETISEQFLDAVASVQTAGGGVGCQKAKV